MPCLCHFAIADHVMLWSGRMWSRHRDKWDAVEAEHRRALGMADGIRLSESLDWFYSTINDSASRHLVLAPINCSRVTEDEILLIGIVAEAQRGNWPPAVALLDTFLPPASLRAVLPRLRQIGELLAGAGHRFTPQPQMLSERISPVYTAGNVSSGLPTSH